jgi:hypothetical protein
MLATQNYGVASCVSSAPPERTVIPTSTTNDLGVSACHHVAARHHPTDVLVVASADHARKRLMYCSLRCKENNAHHPQRCYAAGTVFIYHQASMIVKSQRARFFGVGLDGDLGRLRQWTAPGGQVLSVHARRVAALSWCGELPGVRASAAADVGSCTKESGRRVVRRVPRGRGAPAFCCVRQLSPSLPRARSRAGRRAARLARP